MGVAIGFQSLGRRYSIARAPDRAVGLPCRALPS
jgi:hypothetical protein